MDLTITAIPPEKMQTLETLARSKGKNAEEYVRELIETEILATKSFDEILTPIRQGFKESGLSEDELIALFEEAREEVYQERQKRAND